MKYSLYTFCAFMVLTVVGCKDPYYINVEDSDQNVFIVEGAITSAPAQTYIKLSYSKPVNAVNPAPLITNAHVTIESRDGGAYTLPFNPVTLDYRSEINTLPGQDYRVRITHDGQVYESEWSTLLETPPIADLNFERILGGMNIRISTTDPSGKTRYFRWEFEEDWEINSNYFAVVRYDPGSRTVYEQFDDSLYRCYRKAGSISLLLGTTKDLTSFDLKDQLIHFVNETDDRMSVRYAINVKQYAITEDAYKFYDVMKKISEDMGSIFDPQPSELTGNIVCLTNPQQRVLGYIQASVEQTHRAFISSNDIQGWRFLQQCESYDVPSNPDSLQFYYPFYYLPHSLLTEGKYPSATPNCVDCRLRGGTNEKPAFW